MLQLLFSIFLLVLRKIGQIFLAVRRFVYTADKKSALVKAGRHRRLTLVFGAVLLLTALLGEPAQDFI